MRITDGERKDMAYTPKQPNLDGQRQKSTDPNAAQDGSGQVNDADVAKARADAAASAANVDEQTAGVSKAQLENDTSGSSGAPSSGHVVRKGKGKGVESIGLSGATHFPVDARREIPELVSDLDKYDKNADLLDQAIGKVAAKIVKEATKGTDIKDTGIFGDPSMASIYSEESTTTVETVLGLGVEAPAGHPKSRQNATVFLQNSGVGLASGDILFGAGKSPTSEEYIQGHDTLKGVLNRENFLLNRLTARGRFTTTPQFVMPKRGKFLVLGMNPYGIDGIAQNIVGYTHRQTTNGDSAMYPVYQATDRTLFNVVEVSSIASDIKSVVDEIKPYVVANDSKYEIGMIEHVAQALADAEKYILEPEKVNAYPEFTKAGRSTLRFANDIAGADNNYNCYNGLDEYADFMFKLEHSEILWSGLNYMANSKRILDTMKFHLGQQGRYLANERGAAAYFYNIMKGGMNHVLPDGTPVANIPAIARYAQSMVSPRHITSPGRYLTRLKSVWSRLDECLNELNDGALTKVVGSKIKVNLLTIDQMLEQLEIGRISSESSDSSDIVKFGGDFQFILDFDPNDLVQGAVAGQDLAGNPIINWFPVGGYANILVSTTLTNAETVIYNVLPTWLRTLLWAINDSSFNNRILLRDQSGQNNTNSYFYDWASQSPAPHLPMALDTNEPHFFWFYFAEASRAFSTRIFGAENANCGYLRWLGAKEVFSVDEVYDSAGFGSVYGNLSEAINRVATTKSIYVEPSWTTPLDLPTLSPSAIESIKEEPFDKILEIHHYDPTSFNGKYDHQSIHAAIVLEPTRRDTYATNPAGWSFVIDAETDNANALAAIESAIEFLNDIPDLRLIGTAGYTHDNLGWYRGSVHRQGTLVFTYDAITLNIVVPVRALRYMSKDTRVTSGFPITQFDADASIVGYDTNPKDLLFNRDNFLAATHFDGFYLIAQDSGKYAYENFDDGVAPGVTSPYPLHRRIDFAPVIISTTPASSGYEHGIGGAAGHADNKRTILYLSRSLLADNIIYDANTIANGIPTGNKVYGRTRVGNGIYFRSLLVPSLYGYRRMVLGNFTKQYFYGELVGEERSAYWYSLASGATAADRMLQAGHKLRDFYGFAYVPYNEPTAMNGVTIDKTGLSDPIYYASQRPYFLHFFIDDSLENNLTADLNELMAANNFAFDYSVNRQGAPVISEIDDDVRPQWTFTDDFIVEEVYPVNALFRLKEYEDQYLEYLSDFYVDPLTSYIFHVPTTLGKAGKTVYNSVYQLKHPLVIDSSYFNDIRQYHIDQVFLHLNRDWAIYGSTKKVLSSALKNT